MISRVKIHNFKIHKDSNLPLSPLTIFSGINGMGKSSVSQALLMVRDCVRNDNCYPKVLKLQGNSYNVGDRFGSLVNWFIKDEADKLRVTVCTDDEKEYPFEFQYELNSDTEIPVYPGSKIFDRDELKTIPLFSDSFQYLSAFRFGPKSDYKGDTGALKTRSVSINNGSGENAVALLGKFGNEQIQVEEMAIGSPYVRADLRLDTQTALWLNRISPNVKLAIDNDESANKYWLNYSYPNGKSRVKVSPLNTGFGISYVLSIIVALLISPKGSLVILENPEAHIHPAAQSALMELVSRAVKGGIQVIIETHSDHIVFGALVNMKRNILTHDDVSLRHFDINPYTGELDPASVEIGPDCRIKNAPRHFIEQMNLDLDILFDE